MPADASSLEQLEHFRHLVDRLHQADIGVIADWVPAHFPKDAWALARFDGTALYEHADPARGEHPDWGTYVFDFGRTEVRNFLYAVMAQCQAAQLLLAAVDAVPGMGNVSLLGGHEAALRMSLDVVTCAALLNATLLYPTPLPPRGALAWLSWIAAIVFSGAVLMFDLPQAWWWCKALSLSTGLLVVGLLGWSYRITPHPYATVMRRLSVVTTGTK